MKISRNSEIVTFWLLPDWRDLRTPIRVHFASLTAALTKMIGLSFSQSMNSCLNNNRVMSLCYVGSVSFSNAHTCYPSTFTDTFPFLLSYGYKDIWIAVLISYFDLFYVLKKPHIFLHKCLEKCPQMHC